MSYFPISITRYLPARQGHLRVGAGCTDQRFRASRSGNSGGQELLSQPQRGTAQRSCCVRRRHFAIVNGSLGELSAAIDLAATLGAVDADAARTIDSSCERFAMMLRKLMR